MESNKVKRNKRKTLVGVVSSDKMQKTITVNVITEKRHSLYSKLIKSTKKYKAHDENEIAKIGDKVLIMETRPISKDKRWRLVEVIEKAK